MQNTFYTFVAVNPKYHAMNVENTSIQMRKGILEYGILLVIARGEVYTSDLIEELKEARIIVVEGTLYPLLNRLQKMGLLAYTWKESPSGPPRKYYRLTDDGRAFLDGLHNTWTELTTSIQTILNKTNNPESHEQDSHL
jgi:PadR family transcriptional regulator PadR